eukprot:TRINITY_DN1310_c1_g1_i2.p1 TRINITY_DN1310_c1_g1~~TRINITY_DN1310_c1_g1_i2.p1  ORF type:complete len:148 (-),score=3.39 TRINITY_DN1310_c1_g1_i2:263-706(-)
MRFEGGRREEIIKHDSWLTSGKQKKKILKNKYEKEDNKTKMWHKLLIKKNIYKKQTRVEKELHISRFFFFRNSFSSISSSFSVFLCVLRHKLSAKSCTLLQCNKRKHKASTSNTRFFKTEKDRRNKKKKKKRSNRNKRTKIMNFVGV